MNAPVLILIILLAWLMAELDERSTLRRERKRQKMVDRLEKGSRLSGIVTCCGEEMDREKLEEVREERYLGMSGKMREGE